MVCFYSDLDRVHVHWERGPRPVPGVADVGAVRRGARAVVDQWEGDMEAGALGGAGPRAIRGRGATGQTDVVRPSILQHGNQGEGYSGT